jgi:hypothetical protein
MTQFNKIKYYTVAAKIVANNRIVKIDDNSPLNGAHIVSVWSRRASSTNRSLLGQQLANDANVDGAFLVLKKDTQTKVVEIPLSLVVATSVAEPQAGFPINGEGFNFSSCTIEVQDGITLDTDKVFELTFAYFEPKKA